MVYIPMYTASDDILLLVEIIAIVLMAAGTILVLYIPDGSQILLKRIGDLIDIIKRLLH